MLDTFFIAFGALVMATVIVAFAAALLASVWGTLFIIADLALTCVILLAKAILWLENKMTGKRLKQGEVAI